MFWGKKQESKLQRRGWWEEKGNTQVRTKAGAQWASGAGHQVRETGEWSTTGPKEKSKDKALGPGTFPLGYGIPVQRADLGSWRGPMSICCMNEQGRFFRACRKARTVILEKPWLCVTCAAHQKECCLPVKGGHTRTSKTLHYWFLKTETIVFPRSSQTAIYLVTGPE